MSNSIDFEQLIRKEIPLDFLAGFVKGIPLIYKATYEHIKTGFDTDLKKDILPYYRRGKVDELLLNIANRFNLESSIHFNKKKNCRHVRVKSGSIILTANLVNSPSEMVRRALFRNTLARNNEPSLFPELEDRQTGEYYYAVLLHGTKEKISEAGFVWLAIPSHDSKKYLYRLDLTNHCKVNIYSKDTDKKAEDNIDIKLRRDLVRRQI